MPSTKLFRRVKNTPEDLIDLVSDVEGYPKFITLISAVRVSDHEKTDPLESFEAEASVTYKFVNEKFRSLVKVDHEQKTIKVTKAKRGGIVKTLENSWVFHELGDGSTLVEFFVNVSLSAFPLNLLLRDKFDKAAEHMMKLFMRRAELVYPKVGTDELKLEAELTRLGLTEHLQQLA